MNQIKKMTEEDVEMVEKIDEWLSMQYHILVVPEEIKDLV